jgi:replicative superfamily II helicase
MPQIVSVEDQSELVPTSDFPLLDFSFEHFNPIQSRVIEYYDQPANLVIAAATSSGKTACAEMLLAHEQQSRGGKGMYVAPLKALSQEKIDDWAGDSHGFSSLNLSICTGDYRLTPSRREEMIESDIVLMTSEMLNSRTRNFRSEQNDWLRDVGTGIIDEAHLLTVPQRGDKLEVAIMKMAALNPDCRFVFLSATMPNVEDMAGWLCELTGRDTVVLESNFRPVPLKWNWPVYDDSQWWYQYKESQKVAEALYLVEKYSDDKFLIFAHSKATGEMMCRELRKKAGIETHFHNADLEKAKRLPLEDRFRNDPKLRVIVATSTLSQGVNLPARRVIILGVNRGPTKVPTYEIEQEAGRAGRPKYDKQGDVYILLPRSDWQNEKRRLKTPEKIRSQLLQHDDKEYRTFAFHLVSEIAQGEVQTVEDIYEWYSRSLAAYQFRHLDQAFVDMVLDKLVAYRAVRDEGGKLEVTPLGRVAALFYYSPFDVSNLRRNFTTLFEYDREEDSVWIATALAHIDSHGDPPYISNLEKEQLEPFRNKVDYDVLSAFNNGGDFIANKLKMIFCYYSLMHGWRNPVFAAPMRGLQHDAGRLMQVLKALDGMSAKWDRRDYFTRLGQRLQYGVEWRLLDLVGVPQIGKVRAEKLWAVNIRSAADVAKNPKLVQAVLRCSDKLLAKMVDGAKKVAR